MPVAIDIYTEKFSVCVALIFKFCIAAFLWYCNTALQKKGCRLLFQLKK